ncbi:MAG: purine-nucleoside phosphorylase, partial [Gemmatimonadales bacterium]
LLGSPCSGEERFPDMSDPYDAGWRAQAREMAGRLGIELTEGVYAGVAGPSYETPAEIRLLRRLGADAVGMSTVPEVIAARARGMKCLGISAITNRAAGLATQRLLHQDVLEAATGVGTTLGQLLTGLVSALPDSPAALR